MSRRLILLLSAALVLAWWGICALSDATQGGGAYNGGLFAIFIFVAVALTIWAAALIIRAWGAGRASLLPRLSLAPPRHRSPPIAALDVEPGASDNGLMSVHVPRVPFSLDPLVAEARRRARLRRLLVALIAVVVAAVAAVLSIELRGTGPVAPIPANLTVLVVGESFPHSGINFPWDGGRVLFHLKCDPASGNVADPAKACAAIAAQPSLVTNPKPYAPRTPFTGLGGSSGGPPMQVCHLHPVKLCPANGPDYFKITGTVNGKPVHFGGGGIFATNVPLVEKLGLARRYGQPVVRLEPRRHRFVAMSHTHKFAPGVLLPGDLVTCSTNHRYKYPLAMSVPVHRGNAPERTSATPGLMAIRLRADGAVLASCFPRDRLPLSKRGRTTYPKNWPPKSLRP